MRRHISFTEAARQDVRELAHSDLPLARNALRLAKAIADGRVQGFPLRHFGKTGDLGDCRKAYFGRRAEGDTHRIVFRLRADAERAIARIRHRRRRA